MPRFERVAEYRSNQQQGSYGGLFEGGKPPRLHAFDRPRMTIDKAYVDTTCIGRVDSTGHDVQVVEHEKVSVIIPTEGTIRTQFADQHLAARPGQVLILGRGPRQTNVKRSMSGTYQAIILLFDHAELAMLHRGLASSRSDIPPPDNYCRAVDVASSTPARHLVQLSGVLIDDLDGDIASPLDPGSETHWQQLLSRKLLDTMGSRYGEMGTTLADTPAHRHVRRAMEHMMSAYEEIRTITEVALACGVSTRTLETAFQKEMSRTPWAVLTDIRLDRARQLQLAGGTDSTVASVAYTVGFGHTGRFAKSYAGKFGEPPSATLTRRRFSPRPAQCGSALR